MRSLKHSAVMCSTQYLAAINSLEKVLASIVFYLLLYQMMGAFLNKMINPAWPRRVTLLAVWESSIYTVVVTVMPLVSGKICEGGNFSSASRY